MAQAPAGPIAALVDGEAIGLAEVEATARMTGLTPLAALRRLEQERAVLHLAERALPHADDEIESASQRAAVQALLRARIEDAVGDDAVSDAEIAMRYQSSRSAWARPERRTSVHVLATPRDAHDEASNAAAERFVRDAITRITAAADPVAEAHAIEAEGLAGRTFTLTVESLPATARHGPFEEAYLAALFAIASAPGVAPTPVRTSFGLHAIVLVSIEPAFEVSLGEASPILRRQLVAEHRGAALDALTAQLASETPVSIDERVAALATTADLAPRSAP